MRNFIRIVENASLPILDEYLAQSVLDSALRHGFDMSDWAAPSMFDDVDDPDMDEDERVIDNILGMMHNEWDSQIKPAIHGQQLQVYRAIALSAISQLRTDALGKHWSTAPRQAHPYWGKNRSHWIVLQALVDLKYVDWANTFALHLEGGESEVELFQGTPVTITGLTWHTSHGEVSDPAGSALIGQTLTT